MNVLKVSVSFEIYEAISISVSDRRKPKIASCNHIGWLTIFRSQAAQVIIIALGEKSFQGYNKCIPGRVARFAKCLQSSWFNARSTGNLFGYLHLNNYLLIFLKKSILQGCDKLIKSDHYIKKKRGKKTFSRKFCFFFTFYSSMNPETKKYHGFPKNY